MNNPQQSKAVDETKSTTSQVADQARQKTGEVMQQAQDTAKSTLHEQKGRVASSVGSVADALRQTGDNLHDQDQAAVGRVMQQAADRLEQFSNDLQNKNVDEIFADVQDFAHREPQLFLGGAFLLGLFAARFLKSSAERNNMNQRYSGYQGYPGSQSYRGTTGYGSRGYGSSQGYQSGYSGTGTARTYTTQDLADYRRDVLDNEQTGTYRSGSYSGSETSPATENDFTEDESGGYPYSGSGTGRNEP